MVDIAHMEIMVMQGIETSALGLLPSDTFSFLFTLCLHHQLRFPAIAQQLTWISLALLYPPIIPFTLDTLRGV